MVRRPAQWFPPNPCGGGGHTRASYALLITGHKCPTRNIQLIQSGTSLSPNRRTMTSIREQTARYWCRIPAGRTVSVFCKAVVYLLVAVPAFAQTQTFVTVTVKRARST